MNRLMLYIKIIPSIFCFLSFVLFAQDNLRYKWSEPVNISVLNTKGNDFAPSWNRFDNILYFNSDISKYSMFYTSHEIGNGEFSPPKLLNDEINQHENNQSYITFESNDLAYLSTFRLNQKRSYLNIFQTKYNRQNWNKPALADSLTFDAYTAQPTVSPDGTIMVFSSTRNSDNGDADLWMAFKQFNGTWGSIINLSEINTPGNEITPCLASKDTLYFASDGQEGPGGFDLFRSVYSDGKWGRPYPLSELNTSADESDPAILPGGEIIFASNRPGGKGKLDLYFSRLVHVLPFIDTTDMKVELNMAVQATSVLTKSTNKIQPLLPFNFFAEDEIRKPDIYGIKNNKEIEYNIDSAYKYSLFLIAQRIESNPLSILTIHSYYESDQSNSFLNRVYKFFTNHFNIANDQLIADTLTFNPYRVRVQGNIKSVVLLTSPDETIFSTFNSNEDSITLSPPVLEFSIDARPRNTLANWYFTMDIMGKKYHRLAEGNKLPSEFSIDLKPYRNELAKCDSFTVSLNGIDSKGKLWKNELTINISHTEIKENKVINIGKKYYEQFIIFAFDAKTFNNSGNTFERIFRQIKDKTKNKRVILQYQENTSECKSTAGTIESKLKLDGIIVKTEFSIFSDKHSSQFLQPYTFRILVEK